MRIRMPDWETRVRKMMPRSLVVALLLAAAVLAVYVQTLDFAFLTWDDGRYVTGNARVRQGLSVEGLGWAVTTRRDDNWFPLTWLSHMLDVEIYGDDAGGHHATNVLLHLANTLLLLAVLTSLTHDLWPSAFVAGLFGLHPLHVESVAWISERKELLSTFFGLLSAWAYVAYARRGGAARYGMVALCFALALMAKQMLVTLPFVFLLFDYWPLGRARGAPTGDPACTRRPVGALVVEKLPLLALSAAVSVLTLSAQEHAIEATPEVPLRFRVFNALVSYVRYVGKVLWPSDLSILYPHPYIASLGGEPWSSAQIVGALALLSALTAALLLTARRQPYAIVGWLWYLGTLVPVIGLVQVGRQGLADRYTYVPLIGLFLIAAWGLREVVRRWGERRPALGPAIAALGALVLTACALAAHAQVATWRDSETLYRHSLLSTPGVPLLHYNLARVLAGRGDEEGALHHYRQVVAIDPDHSEAHNNLANALFRRGEREEALIHYREAVRARPGNARAQMNLGNALRARGDLQEALVHYRRAAALMPRSRSAHYALGVALARAGSREEAIAAFRETLRLSPGYQRAQRELEKLTTPRAQSDSESGGGGTPATGPATR